MKDQKLKEMEVREFVRRLKDLIEKCEDSNFVFFIGAGCSVSSGISDAGTLVKSWLPGLKKLKTGDEEGYEKWTKELYNGYQEDKPALIYGRVIEDLFPTSPQRQREIERITEGKDPGFGYSVLSQFMTNSVYGSHCNVLLTVNFDDLLADALYLYTKKKPLVISHEALVGFVRVTRTRPLVIKLHGDARLEPKNTEQETKELSQSVKKALKSLLSDRGLIFIGYGGNDKSIAEILNDLPADSLPWGIYWIGNNIPNSDLGKWLRKRKAIWVKHRDFDELMLLILNEFSLKHPDNKRFEKLINTYQETFKKLKTQIDIKAETPEKKLLEDAVEKATSKVDSWWSLSLKAENYKKTNIEKAEKIYQEGLKRFSDNNYFLTNYAIFLDEIRKDHDKAEEYFRKALKIEPDNANTLSNYAVFLHRGRKDYDKAEEYYKKALKIEPDNANTLTNYALLLGRIRKDHDKAEEYFRKALKIEPDNANTLSSYAVFLHRGRKDYDKAEEYYKKALKIEPDDAAVLTNYAVFLRRIRKDNDKAEEYFRKALKIEPDNAAVLTNYALLLDEIRKDYDKAEEYLRKALKIEPQNDNILSNFAGFLLSQGKYKEGFNILQRVLKLTDEPILLLECSFYQYAHTKDGNIRKRSLTKIKKLLKSGIRSPGFNLQNNVIKAIKDGHPLPEFLDKLSKVISENKNIKELEKFNIWTKKN